ncbi:glutamyl aminopeptidase-like [Coccinella septempunctata]|uniref:glutamyl aminopeptidase-like n=1 Tax=Coccinella septempunctata TaxID=41139 RepID=UPI001D06D2FD|nr:glutamyl aminopeptidase-like [Coccinella septempunctata]
MVMVKVLCLGLVLWSTNVLANSGHFRLQRDVFPTSYSLKLVPDMDGDTFEGEVTIFLRNERPISNVTLNLKKLLIDNITLDQAYGTTKFIVDHPNEIIQVFYEGKEQIDPGEHVLNIKFTGTFGPYVGFYKLETGDNKSRVILATKFSPNHARLAFPCFDEPYFKSTFNIRLVKPNNTWQALSNMREIGRFDTPNGIAVDFESTIPMSTYLLAWTLTDYNYDEIDYVSGDRVIPLRFFNAQKKDVQLREALKVTKKALAFFENYTASPFPLPKLDSIAIPFYMSRGMEHYGLIMYQDHALFKRSPFMSTLQYSIEADLLICHEVSHMWFGNLVTHPWYNDIWLTEGFARYMQYKAGEALLGEPFVKNMFQESKYLSLFQMSCYDDDVTETASYPRTLGEIRTKYGPTTYDQGGALLLMLEDLIGEEKFREVVRKHLKGHEFGCSTTGEFINLMESAAPTLNIRDVMESFLFQNQLPAVNVSIENDHFVLTQSPLCEGGHNSIFGYKWTFPIRYITSSNLNPKLAWFDREMSQVKIPISKDDRWIQINHLNNGLYRPIYSKELYEAIVSDFHKLKATDMGPFIEDAFFMSSIGKIQCDIPLKVIGALRSIKEIDFLTYTYASRSFSLFSQNLEYDTTVTKILRAYFIDIFVDLYDKISWKVGETDSKDKRLLRMAVLESFCIGHPKYGKCYKDVESLRVLNETVHHDVEYIFKAVLRDSRKLNSTMIRENMNYASSGIEENQGEQKCLTWIKQNIPKLIRQRG